MLILLPLPPGAGLRADPQSCCDWVAAKPLMRAAWSRSGASRSVVGKNLLG